jgi:hypothetical protein
MLSVCCLATRRCKNYKNIEYYTTILLWQIDVADNNKRYVGRYSCTVPDAALKKKNIILLMAIFGCTIWLNGLLSQVSRCAVSRFL